MKLIGTASMLRGAFGCEVLHLDRSVCGLIERPENFTKGEVNIDGRLDSKFIPTAKFRANDSS